MYSCYNKTEYHSHATFSITICAPETYIWRNVEHNMHSKIFIFSIEFIDYVPKEIFMMASYEIKSKEKTHLMLFYDYYSWEILFVWVLYLFSKSQWIFWKNSIYIYINNCTCCTNIHKIWHTVFEKKSIVYINNCTHSTIAQFQMLTRTFDSLFEFLGPWNFIQVVQTI